MERRGTSIGYWYENQRERGHKDNKDIGGQIVLRYSTIVKMDLVEIGQGSLDWIGLAQDRYRWRALVNPVMNI
jgi:hypothetical protein